MTFQEIKDLKVANSAFTKNNAVSQLNRVDDFDILQYVKESAYEDDKDIMILPTNPKLIWFRLVYPTGKVALNVIQHTENFAKVEARIYANYTDNEDSYLANSIVEKYPDPEYPKISHLQWAQTSALSNALDLAGFGVQLCDIVGYDYRLPNTAEPINPPDKNMSPEKEISVSEPPSDDPLNLGTSETSAADNIPAEENQPVQQNSVKETVKEDEQPSVKPVPVANPHQKYKKVPYEDILKTMTLQEAFEVINPARICKGMPLKVVIQQSPTTIQWLADNYTQDMIVTAAAKLIYDAAQSKKLDSENNQTTTDKIAS